MATILVTTGITFPDGTTQVSAAAGAFPTGSRVTFQQTSAPTGWTKDTSAALNDTMLRIVTGSVTSGGSTAFSTWNAVSSSGAFTLTTTEMASHAHDQQNNAGDVDNGSRSTGPYASGTGYGPYGTVAALSTQATGGGGAHSHGLTRSLKYYDFIIATKN